MRVIFRVQLSRIYRRLEIILGIVGDLHDLDLSPNIREIK
jgi:hypothetical protein